MRLSLVVVLCAGFRLAAQDATHARADRDEAEYALAVARVADRGIHHLDFFPARAQLRVQMIFLAPRDSAAAIFAEIERRSIDAGTAIDDISFRFEKTPVPDDLHVLHGALLTSLRSARAALDRLGIAASACERDPSSVSRCQTPITSASSAVAQAYSRYLDVRGRIASQVSDTRTTLPAFAVSSRR